MTHIFAKTFGILLPSECLHDLSLELIKMGSKMESQNQTCKSALRNWSIVGYKCSLISL